MLDICVIVYIDNEDLHCEHIHKVLQHLCKHGLFCSLPKFSFNMDTVEYLSYILSPEGLTMSPEKVQVIVNWPEPWKVKDV